MPVPAPQPQDSHAILVIVLFLACICVAYWRTVLRVIAILLIALAIYGMITGVSGLHHTTG